MKLYARCRGRRLFLFLVFLCLLWGSLAVFAPWLSPADPLQVDMGARLQPESLTHGTDQLGRDELSRVLYGGRVTLSVALSIVSLSAVAGILLGAVMSLADNVLARSFSAVLDFFLAMPVMAFTIAIIGITGPSLPHMVLAMVVTGWAEYARITQTIVLAEKEKGYLRYAVFAGAGFWHRVFRYLLPNVVPQLLVFLCQHVSQIILLVAGFSLIGIGVQPPVPEWGMLLMSSRNYMQTAPWLLLYPGLAIFVTVVLLNLLGDVLRDLADPRERRWHRA